MAKPPRYITPEGFQKLRDEMQWLWKEERPRVTQEVSTAADHGDRSENAEYQYGKRRLREIDRRLQFLSKRVEELTVMTDAMQRRNPNKAGFGAWVVVADEDGEESCFRLVGPDEVDATLGLISIESPMGHALLGREVDEEVEVRRPKGTAYITILEIHFGANPRPETQGGSRPDAT